MSSITDVTWKEAEAICQTYEGRQANPKLAAALATADKTNYLWDGVCTACGILFILVSTRSHNPVLFLVGFGMTAGGSRLIDSTLSERRKIEEDKGTDGSPYLASLLSEKVRGIALTRVENG